MKLKMERIYLSGKISGLPWKDVVGKFMEAERRVRLQGNMAENPIRFGSDRLDWQANMRLCLQRLLLCDKILLLPDWKRSRGARIEWLVALSCGIPILKWDETDKA